MKLYVRALYNTCVISPFIPLRSVKSTHLRCWRACEDLSLTGFHFPCKGKLHSALYIFVPTLPVSPFPFLLSSINNIHIYINILIYTYSYSFLVYSSSLRSFSDTLGQAAAINIDLSTSFRQRIDAKFPSTWGFQDSPRAFEVAIDSIKHFQQVVNQTIHNRNTASSPKRRVFDPQEITISEQYDALYKFNKCACHRTPSIKGTTELYETYHKKMPQRLLEKEDGRAPSLRGASRALS